MLRHIAIAACALGLVAAGCSADSAGDSSPHATAEASVVAWFDAIEAGDVQTAAASVHPESMALIFGIENSIGNDELASFISHGVPLALQDSYWRSFRDGFTEFANKPLSALSVGAAESFVSNGETFASVPVSSGAAGDTIVLVRQRPDGTWEVDMVATLGDGFSKLLLDEYELLGASENDTRIRLAYAEVVAPSMWAALAGGEFGDEFARTALTLIDRIEGESN